MTQTEFEELSKYLREIVKDIPSNWGKKQNNRYDRRLRDVGYNIFDINKLDDLREIVKEFSDVEKNYFFRRWFLLKCSRCEEYLFYRQHNVIHNPQSWSKSWDVRIDSQYEIKKDKFLCTHYFDIKGARIPEEFIDNDKFQDEKACVNEIIKDPRELIRYYYNNQSEGVRFDMQNRLFLVHHSFVKYEREKYLRVAWRLKRDAAEAFLNHINDIVLYSYRGCTVGIIFILEKEPQKLEFYIPGHNQVNNNVIY